MSAWVVLINGFSTFTFLFAFKFESDSLDSEVSEDGALIWDERGGDEGGLVWGGQGCKIDNCEGAFESVAEWNADVNEDEGGDGDGDEINSDDECEGDIES